MTDNLRRILNAADKSRNKRDIVTDMVMRWPDGVVPYVLDASLSKYSCKLYSTNNSMAKLSCSIFLASSTIVYVGGACKRVALPFFLMPTTSKRLLGRLLRQIF